MNHPTEPSPNPAPRPAGPPGRPQALPALTLTELVRAIRDGSLSPADLVTEVLASLDRWQPVTTTASQVWPEEALDAARALPSDPHLPLAGVPVLVKENMDVAGHISACGPTHNPWDPGRLAGGSAAAVAARSVPFALGTHTAGNTSRQIKGVRGAAWRQ
jgi:Asp-tRNA(Asn)/Glu-tRNA(Gln) amidotransferase A subunit family amidase